MSSTDTVILFNSLAMLGWTVAMIFQGLYIQRLVKELKRLRLLATGVNNAG